VEIKPIFDVHVDLTAIYVAERETAYQFEILTEKNRVPVNVELKLYVVARDYMNASYAVVSDGETSLNITLPNGIEGPALLVVFARAVSNTKIVSFATYAFAHNSPEPEPDGSFLRLSPLNQSLVASKCYQEISLSNGYALTFDYFSVLEQVSNEPQSATYSIPKFADASPIILTVSGWNQTTFFTEWAVYPHLPIQFGADFQHSGTLSEVFTYTYIVSVDSALYECSFWIGGSSA